MLGSYRDRGRGSYSKRSVSVLKVFPYRGLRRSTACEVLHVSTRRWPARFLQLHGARGTFDGSVTRRGPTSTLREPPARGPCPSAPSAASFTGEMGKSSDLTVALS